MITLVAPFMVRYPTLSVGVAVASLLASTVSAVAKPTDTTTMIGLVVLLWYTVPSIARLPVTSDCEAIAPPDPDDDPELSSGLFKRDLQGLNCGVATFGADYINFTDPGKVIPNVKAAIRQQNDRTPTYRPQGDYDLCADGSGGIV
jgi:hypothetical protein